MTRHKMLLACALGGLAMAAAPLPAHAQSGHALVLAEHVCLDNGVTPNTAAFESCVRRAARAYDRGQPDMAYIQARWTREARETCLAYGLPTDTLGYRQCVATEVDRRINRTTVIRYSPLD